jgi:putative membrane protein
MTKVGLAALVLTSAVAMGCGGDRDQGVRDDGAPGTNRTDTVGTGGEARDTTTTPGDTRPQGVAGDVERWVHDITMHNTAEIELGKIASERAANAQVKQYGQMMVKDHTNAGNELKQAVAGKVQVQEQMDEKHRDLAQRLRGLQGAEFDREYMNAMVDGHQEVKGMLEDRARDAKNTNANTSTNPNAANAGADQLEAAVNQWAAKTLPAVEKHLQRAEQLRDTVQNSGRTTQNTPETNRNRAGQ